MFHRIESADVSSVPRWVALGVAGLLLFGCGSDDDDTAAEDTATTVAATDDIATDDEMADDEMADDEMADDEMADDEMADDEMADDEMADDETAGGSEVEIVGVSEAFDPATLTVAAGTEVTWTNADGVDHTVTADDDTFDSEAISGGDDFSFTFDEPGTYSYFCAIHPSMTGEIVVE